MKVRVVTEDGEEWINLTPETPEEYQLLLKMYHNGARVWGGGSYTSISAKKEL